MSATPKHPTAPDARGAHSLDRLVMPPVETFSEHEVEHAIRQFLQWGEQEYQKSHKGYFSGPGWAARCLRYHLSQLDRHNDTGEPPGPAAAELRVHADRTGWSRSAPLACWAPSRVLQSKQSRGTPSRSPIKEAAQEVDDAEKEKRHASIPIVEIDAKSNEKSPENRNVRLGRAHHTGQPCLVLRVSEGP